METDSLMPMAGIKTEGDEAALVVGGEGRRIFVRDAVNVDFTGEGRVRMRRGVRQVTTRTLCDLWHSPLHGDTFAREGAQWVRVRKPDWSVESLATIGEGPASHLALNGRVWVAGAAGIFVFDGAVATPLEIATPPAPMITSGAGALAPGRYGVAISWLRGKAESATSSITHMEMGAGGALEVTLPLCFDPTVTHVRLYVTRPNGGVLYAGEDYPAATAAVTLPLLPSPGAEAKFQYLGSMPSGSYLSYWQGRLITARSNVLRFSEPMAYHLHDPRHGFVQMSQRITFVAPVDGGIFVGQTDHVAFLQGDRLETLTLQRRSTRSPLPGSSTLVDAQAVGQASAGGRQVAVWLAENGYVLGASDGSVVELHANVLGNITGSEAQTVAMGGRLITIVQ